MKTIKKWLLRKVFDAIITKKNSIQFIQDKLTAGSIDWKYYQSKIKVLDDLTEEIKTLYNL